MLGLCKKCKRSDNLVLGLCLECSSIEDSKVSLLETKREQPSKDEIEKRLAERRRDKSFWVG